MGEKYGQAWSVWHHLPHLTKYASFKYSKLCYKQNLKNLVWGTCPTFYTTRSVSGSGSGLKPMKQVF